MPVSITIRSVPHEVHERLVSRAKAAGQSLQEYLVAELTKLVEKPTLDEWLDEVRRRAETLPPLNLTVEEALADIAADKR